MRRLLAVSEVVLLAILEAEDNATEAFDRARKSVEEYAAAVDAAAADVTAAAAEMDAAVDAAANSNSEAWQRAAEGIHDYGESVHDSEGALSDFDKDLWDVSRFLDDVAGSAEDVKSAFPGMEQSVEDNVNAFERFHASAEDVHESLGKTREDLFGSEEEFKKFYNRVDDSEQHVGRFRSAFDSLRKEVGSVGFSARKMGEDAEDAGKDTEDLGDEVEKAGSKAGGSLKKWQLIGLAIAALAGPIQGVIALGPAAFFLGLGAAATGLQNHLLQLQQQGQKLTATQQAELRAVTPVANAFRSLQPVIAKLAGSFANMIQSVGPQLRQAFSALGPVITVAGGGLTNFVKILITGLAPQVSRMMPVVHQFAAGLGTLASSITHMISSINVTDAANGMHSLFSTASEVVNVISTLMNVLSPFSSMLLDGLLTPVLKVVDEWVGALGPALRAIGSLMAPIGQLIMKLGTAFMPLISTVSKVVVTLVGGLVPVITKLTPIIAQLGGLVGDILVKALNILLPAIMPLLPPLAQLAGAVLQALVSILAALEPGILAIVRAFVTLLPPLMPIITAVVQLVQVLTPVLVILAKLVSLLAGPVALAFTLVDSMMLHALVPAIQTLGRVFTDWWSMTKKLIADLVVIFSGFVEFFQGVFTGNMSKAVAGVKKIWQGLKAYFVDFISGMYNIGKDIIMGVVHGVEAAAGALLDKVRQIASSLVSAFKGALNIFSPSRVMADEVGAYIPAGIAQGMLAHAHLISNAASQLGRQAVTGTQLGVNVGLNSGLSASNAVGGGNSSRPIQFIMQGNQLMSDRDMETFVNKMGSPLVNMLQRAGVNIRK